MQAAMKPGMRDRAITWSSTLLRTRVSSPASDLALAAVRFALAWIFIYYGGSKLFGWWHGMGIHGTTLYFANTAHLHPGGFFAVLGGLIEFGGAIAIALGFASRLAGMALVGDMVMAMITVTFGNGFNSEKLPAGYEFNVALAVLALVIVILGAGRLSVDALLERRIQAMGPTATP